MHRNFCLSDIRPLIEKGDFKRAIATVVLKVEPGPFQDALLEFASGRVSIAPLPRDKA